MRKTAAGLLVVAVALLLSACGGGDDDSAATTTANPPASAPSNSPQGQASAFGRRIENFGEPATGADREQIERVTVDFYFANAAANGEQACAQLTDTAQKAVAESFGSDGDDCADAFTAQLKKQPARIRELSRSVDVTGARVDGNRGYVLFKTDLLLPSELPVRRVDGDWKLDAVAASPLGYSG